MQPYHGRIYSAGPISLSLNPDNTFEMKQINGDQTVTGQYQYENGVVRFAEPKGAVGDAKFPMQCRFEVAGANEFRLVENDGSCTLFKEMTFKPAAG